MAANTTPNFTKNGVIGNSSAAGSPGARVTAANTSSAGGGTIGTDIFKACVAGADGTFIESVRWMPVATTPTSTTNTCGRIFVSSITSGTTTNADTFCISEVNLPVSGADNATAPVNPIDVPINYRLPSGWSLLATNHAAPAANTNWLAIPFGGDF